MSSSVTDNVNPLTGILLDIVFKNNFDSQIYKYLVIHPKIERSFYIYGLLEKSVDLGEYLGLTVILSKEIDVKDFILA